MNTNTDKIKNARCWWRPAWCLLIIRLWTKGRKLLSTDSEETSKEVGWTWPPRKNVTPESNHENGTQLGKGTGRTWETGEEINGGEIKQMGNNVDMCARKNEFKWNKREVVAPKGIIGNYTWILHIFKFKANILNLITFSIL